MNTDLSTAKKITYIYDDNNNIINYLNKNYGYNAQVSSLKDGYISTDTNDTKASGFLKVVNSICLDGDVYEYEF